MESELHAARGLYPRPGPAGRRKGPGAQGAGVGRGRDGMGTETGTGTGTGQGPGQRWGQDQEAVWAPGQAPLTPRLSQTGESLGPSRPPCSHLGESVLLYAPCPVWRRHRPKKGVTQLGCGAGSRGAQPHPTARGLLARLAALASPGTGTARAQASALLIPLGSLSPAQGLQPSLSGPTGRHVAGTLCPVLSSRLSSASP